MSLWTSSVISLLLLQSVHVYAQPADEELPPPLVLTNRDRDLARAYMDVFKILSDQNACSRFYGGSRLATSVLNEFAERVKPDTFLREVTFQMSGRTRLIRDDATGRVYRVFERSKVNRSGSFYQRRTDSLHRFPADVGRFPPGSRPARALILLHELAHLIQGEDGAWLIPDDGREPWRSTENTIRVQKACRSQLEALN